MLQAEKVDMLIGSVAIGLCLSSGFCAGSRTVVDHHVPILFLSIPQFLIVNDFQRINGPSFVFSASISALLAVSASEGINILRSTPLVMTALQDNIRAARAILDRVDCITIPSHPASPIIHIYIRSSSSNTPGTNLLHPVSAAGIPAPASKPSIPNSTLPCEAVWWDWDVEAEERVWQEQVEGRGTGVMITKAKRFRGQEMVEAAEYRIGDDWRFDEEGDREGDGRC